MGTLRHKVVKSKSLLGGKIQQVCFHLVTDFCLSILPVSELVFQTQNK